MRTEPDEDRSAVGVLDKIRANPTGRVALKIGIAVLGALVIALGILLIPFPGPGWAIVILGLAIWALEFAWAKALLTVTKRYVRAWTRWMAAQPWPVRGLIGVAGLLLVMAIVWGSVKLSFGVDLVSEGRDWLANR